jgi:hypothetical protein
VVHATIRARIERNRWAVAIHPTDVEPISRHGAPEAGPQDSLSGGQGSSWIRSLTQRQMPPTHQGPNLTRETGIRARACQTRKSPTWCWALGLLHALGDQLRGLRPYGHKVFFLMRTRGTIAEDTIFPALAGLISCVKCKQKRAAKSMRPVHQREVANDRWLRQSHFD